MKVTIRQKTGMDYLYADISVSGVRVKSTLGISVKDGEFNPKTQLVKGSASSETNILINQLKIEVMEIVRDLQKTGELSRANVKEAIQRVRDKTTNRQEEPVQVLSFVEYAEKHVERSVATRRSGTVRQYKVSLGKLIDYQRHTRVKLAFEDINIDFYNSFIDYCNKLKQLSVNSIGTHIKNIKMWMNASLLDGIHTSQTHHNRAFKRPTEAADTIYLNETELRQIINTIMPTSCLENVRDLFILACYTGVRMQDYGKLNRFHLINEGTMLKIRTEKTGVEVVIPLHGEAKKVLTKYNGMPRMISGQKFNEYLKEVCKIAGIEEIVRLTRTTGGKKITTVKHKYELVSSHCARRSFATNAYKSGVPTLAIMAITGHTTEKVFLKYVRVSKEEHAGIMSKHDFFKSNVA